MNELITNSQRMTSLEIAEVTGKPHNDVLKAIRKMEEAWVKVQGGKFSLLQKTYVLPNGGTKSQPFYNLTKTECLYIATKFSDEARAKLVLRWEQLEKERIMQGAIRHMLVSDNDVMTEAERIVTNTLVNSRHNADGCLTASDIARIIGIGVNDLNSFLVDRGIQRRARGQFRLTENYEGQGLAEDRLFIYYPKTGKQKRQTYLVWTPKGADFILGMI